MRKFLGPPQQQRVRAFSRLAADELIILNPRQSGILKQKPRTPHSRRSIPMHGAGVLPQPLGVVGAAGRGSSVVGAAGADAGARAAGADADTAASAGAGAATGGAAVLDALDSQKPELSKLSPALFARAKRDLARGFQKKHLDAYLLARSAIPPSRFRYLRKLAKAELILTKVWGCAVDERRANEGAGAAGAALVDHVIDLLEHEFVLVLANSGHMLREWTKSGARVRIWPRRRQILVSSREETFEWIDATLRRFLDSCTAQNIDVAALQPFLSTAQPQHFAAIQQLSSTYFVPPNVGDDGDGCITVVAGGQFRARNMQFAKRLLLQLCEPAILRRWRPETVYMQPIDDAAFHPVSENDAMPWFERMHSWARWEMPKRRLAAAVADAGDADTAAADASAATSATADADADIALQPFEPPQFGVTAPEPAVLPLQEHLRNIATRMRAAHLPPADGNAAVAATLTITPGFLMHEPGSSLLPHAGMRRAFCATIPYAVRAASSLGNFEHDVTHEAVETATLSADQAVDQVAAGTAAGTATESTAESDGAVGTVDAAAAATPTTASSKADALWDQIMNADADDVGSGRDAAAAAVYVNRRSDVPANVRMIRMRFVPEPGAASAEAPPVEAWAELPPPSIVPRTPQRLAAMPRVFAVPLEATSYVALPSQPADLRVSLSHSVALEPSELMRDFFMQQCTFTRLYPVSVPLKLMVHINGRDEPYLYHGATYATLAELRCRDSLLQLSLCEGGKYSGRQTEASIVEHGEIDVNRAVDGAMQLLSLLNESR